MPGFQELLAIAVVALLVLGPERLPQAARAAGKLVARLRAASQHNLAELQQVAEIRELRQELDGLRRELHGAGGDLRRRVVGTVGTGAVMQARPQSGARRDAHGTPSTPFDPEAT